MTFNNSFITKEIALTVCGRILGQGASRKVYECAVNQDLVVKIEEEAGGFSNVSEWIMWNEHLQEHEWAGKFFAPCVHISPCGSVLFMRRTHPPRHYPDWIPAYWTDQKLSNFGMIGDQLVCHDYGTSLIEQIGLDHDKPRFKNARWWHLNDAAIS